MIDIATMLDARVTPDDLQLTRKDTHMSAELMTLDNPVHRPTGIIDLLHRTRVVNGAELPVAAQDECEACGEPWPCSAAQGAMPEAVAMPAPAPSAGIAVTVDGSNCPDRIVAFVTFVAVLDANGKQRVVRAMSPNTSAEWAAEIVQQGIS